MVRGATYLWRVFYKSESPPVGTTQFDKVVGYCFLVVGLTSKSCSIQFLWGKLSSLYPYQCCYHFWRESELVLHKMDQITSDLSWFESCNEMRKWSLMEKKLWNKIVYEHLEWIKEKKNCEYETCISLKEEKDRYGW